MKKIYYLFLIVTIYCHGQEIEKESRNNFDFQPVVRIGIVQTNQFGNYSVAKDFNPRIGLDLAASFIGYKKLYLYTGFQTVKYEVTNFNNVGNASFMQSRTIYTLLEYEIPLKYNFTLAPSVGIGYVNNRYEIISRKLGNQEGSEFKLGTKLNYNLTKNIGFFLNTNYASTHLKINTNEAYIDYFGKGNRVEFSLGIRLKATKI